MWASDRGDCQRQPKSDQLSAKPPVDTGSFFRRRRHERGVQLYPCGIATVTPQIFTVASWPVVTSRPEVPQPGTAGRRVRTATSPYPPDLSWWAVKGRQTLISRVHLLVSLTGPASSGSADTSRRCQGCSHPHQHLLDQAALSFTQPLRRPGDEGLSPPFDFRRLVAHVLFGPINPTEHLHSPTSLVGWQPNQVGARAALMEGICGPTPDQPFMTPANPKDLGLHLSGPNGRALSKRSALAAGSTHKSSDRPTPAASKTRRTTTYIRR